MTQSEGWAPLRKKGVCVFLTGLFLQDATAARVWRAVTFTLCSCSAKEKYKNKPKKKRQRWEWSCSSLSAASPYITGRVSRLLCCVIRYFRSPCVGDGWRRRFNVEVKNTGCRRDQWDHWLVCWDIQVWVAQTVVWGPIRCRLTVRKVTMSWSTSLLWWAQCDSRQWQWVTSVSALSYMYSWKSHICKLVFRHSEGVNMWESLSGYG